MQTELAVALLSTAGPSISLAAGAVSLNAPASSGSSSASAPVGVSDVCATDEERLQDESTRGMGNAAKLIETEVGSAIMVVACCFSRLV